MKRFLKMLPLITGSVLWAMNAFAQSNTGWSLVWSEEFSQPNGSSPDPAKWVFETGASGWGNNELEYYTTRTNNARIENGQLVIEALKENFSTASYTSARLKTQGKLDWAYGRIEARIKIPRGQGIWPAFWMLGTNISPVGWPNCGEIDIMENIGKEPGIVHGTVHGPGYSGGESIGGPYSLPDGADFADDFHVYGIEWTTNQIKWFVDGREYFRVTPDSLPTSATWVFNKPQFLLLNLAVGGKWPGNPDATTVFPQRMVVDYIRVYAPTYLADCEVNGLLNPGFEQPGFANWTRHGGNTYIERITNYPVYEGSNVFKVFGQFNGLNNDTDVTQDIPATAGQGFTASGWIFIPGNDRIAGANSAWLEVSFRNAAGSPLKMYRSEWINSGTAAGAWLNFAVTNEINPGNAALIGTVTNLVAPDGTSFARYRLVFRQIAQAAGSVLFDDLLLNTAGTTELPVATATSVSGENLNLEFATYLDVPYQVCWKSRLVDSDWQVLTNFSGDGKVQALRVDLQASSRFFRVTRACN